MMQAFTKLSASSGEITLADVPVPEVDSHELLVRVQAVGVGVHDEYFIAPNVHYPYVIGIEAAGVIEQVGNDVTDYQIGERIAFVSAMQIKGGTWAEYAAVSDSSLILSMPDDMDVAQAAVLPVAGNTVLKAFRAMDLQSGDAVFIAGGSGAIGTLAIQIAASRGFKIAASASPQNHDYMKSLGADMVVDYHDDDWTDQVRRWQSDGVDGAIAIQPGTALQCQSVVKDGGSIVAVSGDQFTPERGIVLQQIPQTIDVTTELNDVVHQVAAGTMKLPIEKTYPFEEGLQALERVKTRHNRGKLVLTLV